MELWIRSQDRECLMKIDRVDYGLSNSEHRIMVNGYETLVGHYATKERALEVLDEIQNIIIGKYMTNVSFEASFSKFDDEEEAIKTLIAMVVYEMPKE